MKRKTTAVILVMSLWLSVFGAHVSSADEDGAPNSTRQLLDSLFNGGGKGKADERNEDGGTSEETDDGGVIGRSVVEDSYAQVTERWEKEGVQDAPPFRTVIRPAQMAAGSKNAKLVPAAESQNYGEEVLLWDGADQEIRFTVRVPADGLYRIAIDYYTIPGKITPVERGIQINGEFPYFEARRIVFPRLWKDASEQFQRDELGNDVFAEQKEEAAWQSAPLMDASHLHDEPLKFYLRKGENRITLLYVREAMLLGGITVMSPESVPAYEEYLVEHGGDVPEVGSVLDIYEAEHPHAKSDSYIQAVASGDINVTPYRNSLISLNTLGADSWKHGGQSVTWKIRTEKAGYYHIAFKYTQYFKNNMPVFRKVMIDGEVPFAEMTAVAFPFAPDWSNLVLAGADGKPYAFYFGEGEHTITLVANPAPYQPVIRTVKEVMDDLNRLYLEIKMATGNTQDVNRDWDILEQMPDIVERLYGLAARLREGYDHLRELAGRDPDEARNLAVAADQLERLARNPDAIPYRFKQISEGAGSIRQKLGDLLLMLPQQPLQLDKFYVYADAELPRARASWWQKIVAVVRTFFTSFTKDYSQISPADDDALRIWVNRPRQYVMMMQQLANREFTARTGIKVSLSIMPNEQKLILANASGESPDAALGVSEKFPYELALRGALADLRQFDGFPEVLARFAPGAMLPFVFDGGVYALPETQNFWVLYYRKDILDAIGLEAPQTWDDVLNILPDLQRYGMNVYVPIADVSALKSFSLTAPFIYQFGGELFAEDGTRTAVDSERALEGFKWMTSIFTVYNMPLQVANFYNHFRNGTLPVGISNYNTYVELTTAAPELAGWWKIAPYPGVKSEDGSIVRWAPGSGQSVILFKNSDKQQEAWEFLRWWTSAEVQAEFGNLVETVYGPTYRWNTANLEAFRQLPWPEEDMEVILEQWRWLKDVPHVPGDYMLDRELSNAWNKVVMDGENPRKALEDAAVLANREMMKKLEEFGYVREGRIVRTLTLPTIEKIVEMRRGAE
jgi:ABC-type glycerol-3-phosphate transport system substrate-binding protein